MSAQPSKRGEEERKRAATAGRGEEHKGTDDSRSRFSSATAWPTAGHKRDSTALADSNSSSHGTTQGFASKKSRSKAPESAAKAAAAAAASSSQPAAVAAASSSSSTPPPLQLRVFSSPVRALLTSLLPMIERAKVPYDDSLRVDQAEAMLELQEAREIVHELREELQQLQADHLDNGHIELEQQIQQEIEQNQANIQETERWQAQNEADRLVDQRLEQKSDQMFRVHLAQAESSTGEMTVVLAHAISMCQWSCSGLLSSQIPPELLELHRSWLSRACPLLEQLAAQLTAEEIRADPRIVSTCAEAGVLPAVQRMLQLSGTSCAIDELLSGEPYLSILATEVTRHVENISPLLLFFRYGLDPTLVSKQYPQSALQLAREHAKSHPLPPTPASTTELELLAESMTLDESCPLSNLVIEYITQQTAATLGEEEARCRTMHTRFMHALVTAWSAHMAAVRALLEEPLIPHLANLICVKFLDEPVKSDDGDEEEAEPADGERDSAVHAAAGQESKSAS